MPTSKMTRRRFLNLSAMTATLYQLPPPVLALPPPTSDEPRPPQPTAVPAGAANGGADRHRPPLSTLRLQPGRPSGRRELPPLEGGCRPTRWWWSAWTSRASTAVTSTGRCSKRPVLYATFQMEVSPLGYQAAAWPIVPNVASSCEVSEDARSYTFHLRQGMKWSDGEPFTADDVMFWYQDIALNQELTPAFPSWLTVAGEPVTIEKIDAYTIRLSWTQPYTLLLEMMSYNGTLTPIFAPAHYLKQFHPAYTDPQELQAKVEEANFEAWYQLFLNRNDWTVNPELPTAADATEVGLERARPSVPTVTPQPAVPT